jgi:hypothetical protein
MAVTEITLSEEEFQELDKLCTESFRAQQDAELEMQRLKYELLQKQKAMRDYLFQLSKIHPIDPSSEYILNKNSKTMTLKS